MTIKSGQVTSSHIKSGGLIRTERDQVQEMRCALEDVLWNTGEAQSCHKMRMRIRHRCKRALGELQGDQVLSSDLLLKALMAAWAYIDQVPCDPDIYEKQLAAWNEHVAARREVKQWISEHVLR